jgi:hypothetical protein
LPSGPRRGDSAPRGNARKRRDGRTAAERALDPEAVTLAAVASVRHKDTAYDDLLMSGITRAVARDRVRADVDQVLNGWRAEIERGEVFSTEEIKRERGCSAS